MKSSTNVPNKVKYKRLKPFNTNKRFFFCVGSMNKDKNNNVYTRTKIDNLISIVIKHFYNYPLLTKKRSDYLLFKSSVFKR